MISKIQNFLETLYKYKPGSEIYDFVINQATLNRLQDELEQKVADQTYSTTLKGFVYLAEQGQVGYDILNHHKKIAIGIAFGDYARTFIDSSPKINHENIDAFLTVIEETSHAYYAMYRHEHGMRMSVFESELQADIDKFIISFFYFQKRGGVSRSHIDAFCRNINYDNHPLKKLLPEVYIRDADSRYYSQIYNRFLFSELKKSQHGKFDKKEFLNEINDFFRMGMPEKIEKINSKW